MSNAKGHSMNLKLKHRSFFTASLLGVQTAREPKSGTTSTRLLSEQPEPSPNTSGCTST